MGNHEDKLSDYIDQLNAEKTPDGTTDSKELAELFQTVNLIRSLKEPIMPEAGFQKKLIRSFEKKKVEGKRPNKNKWIGLTAIASVAAIILLSVLLRFPFDEKGIVHAMEQAFQNMNAYHGIIEITTTNERGESTNQSKLEVWVNQDGQYHMKMLEGNETGLVTVNNGDEKWQVRPEEKAIYQLPAFPDSNPVIFELGNEIAQAKNAIKTKVIGKDTLAGRDTTIIQVTPNGGDPYKIWVDNETNLPLQKQTAMYHAIQYTTTYTQIEYQDAIPADLLAYDVPAGFQVINDQPEQLVANVMEAKNIVGFLAINPEPSPTGYEQKRISVVPDEKLVKIYYESIDGAASVMIMERKATEELRPDSNAVLGKLGGVDAEIQVSVQADDGILGAESFFNQSSINSIHWQENGLEYAVVGNASLDDLQLFTTSINKGKLELPKAGLEMKPAIDVPYDLNVEENEQKSVDAGHSPWRLDPAFVAQVFVSLQIYPEGIVGDYPIDIQDFKVVKQTKQAAIVEVDSDQSPVAKVYLKRLIRQDETGIWTVVGYDPVK